MQGIDIAEITLCSTFPDPSTGQPRWKVTAKRTGALRGPWGVGVSADPDEAFRAALTNLRPPSNPYGF